MRKPEHQDAARSLGDDSVDVDVETIGTEVDSVVETIGAGVDLAIEVMGASVEVLDAAALLRDAAGELELGLGVAPQTTGHDTSL